MLSLALAGLVLTSAYPVFIETATTAGGCPTAFRHSTQVTHTCPTPGTLFSLDISGGHGHCVPSVVNQDLLLFSLRSEGEEAVLEGPPAEEPAPGQNTAQHCLWVDEFAPQHYTELLSDDVSSHSHSRVTGLLYQQGEESRVQLMFVLVGHWLLRMMLGL